MPRRPHQRRYMALEEKIDVVVNLASRWLQRGLATLVDPREQKAAKLGLIITAIDQNKEQWGEFSRMFDRHYRELLEYEIENLEYNYPADHLAD